MCELLIQNNLIQLAPTDTTNTLTMSGRPLEYCSEAELAAAFKADEHMLMLMILARALRACARNTYAR